MVLFGEFKVCQYNKYNVFGNNKYTSCKYPGKAPGPQACVSNHDRVVFSFTDKLTFSGSGN